MVYSCSTSVKFVFTVHGQNFDSTSSRTCFLGQYSVDANNVLKRAFLNGKPFLCKGNLGPMEMESRDQKFGSLPNKSDSISSQSGYGKISYEVCPISNVDSKCGIIEEILSAVLGSSLIPSRSRKKWYAVFADRQLYLFSQYGDSRPKLSIPLPPHGVHIEWHDDNQNIIRISNLNNQSWLFTSQNSQQLKAWYNKVWTNLQHAHFCFGFNMNSRYLP